MKNLTKFGDKTIFFVVLFLLLALNILATQSEIPLFLYASKAIFMPFFLVAFFINNRTLHIAFIAFIALSFFGDVSALFFSSDSAGNTENIMYLFSYIALIIIGVSKFKLAEIDKVIGFYLLGILLINGYFLFTICDILRTLITDGTEMILFGVKSMALILLVFISFAVYLTKQSKASILFLIMAICFAFSDILEYVVNYYIYDWRILMIDRLCHITGLFFAFKYIIEMNIETKSIHGEKDVQGPAFSRDNILA